jgi:hypothetical protein
MTGEGTAEPQPNFLPELQPEQESIETPVQRAIRTGDASHVVHTDDLLAATLNSIEQGRTLHTDTLSQLFNLAADGSAKRDNTSLTSVSWNPTHDAATLIPTFGQNTTLLYTNSVTQPDKTLYQKSIAVIGEAGSRYLVMGGNPMRNYRRDSQALNDQMHQLLLNSLAWLTAGKDTVSANVNIIIAHMDDSYYFPDEQGVRQWLNEYYPHSVTYNEADSCDDDALVNCLNSTTDLLVISQHMNESSSATGVTKTVANAMQRGIPVLYLHLDGGLTALGSSLLSLFDVEYEWDNYWKKLQLADFDASDRINLLPEEIASVKKMVRHLRTQDYAFDWSLCNGENCSAVDGLDKQMQYGADSVRALMTGLDTRKHNLFEDTGYEFQKLLALSGDHLRQSIVFPMDKQSTDDNTLMRAWFADHAVYHYRAINPAQPDMGNFSRSDFSHVTAARQNSQHEQQEELSLRRCIRPAGTNRHCHPAGQLRTSSKSVRQHPASRVNPSMGTRWLQAAQVPAKPAHRNCKRRDYPLHQPIWRACAGSLQQQ